MQPGDRVRIFRSLAMGLGSLLLLSGAVFASQSGHRADDRLQAAPSGSQEASESAEPSRSPDVDGFPGGQVEDASHSPEASPEDEAGDDDNASPSASQLADEDRGGEDGTSGPGGEDDNSGPGGGEDDHSGPGGGDDDAGHDDHSGPGHGGEDD